MVDITHKSSTLRTAVAEGIVKVGSIETIEAIKNNLVPKGDVLEAARVAGLFGVKRTSDMIPDCHPMPVEYTGVEYDIRDLEIVIRMTVKTIYKTGVEVEAMHGVSVAAITMYDMLKPIDKKVEVKHIRLVNKKGGKSDFKDKFRTDLKAAVIVCSDSISAGKKKDKAGRAIIDKLTQSKVEVTEYAIIPDEKVDIQTICKKMIEAGNDMVIYTGGTGLSDRDVTPQSLIPMLDVRIPGIEEAIRSYGQDRTPYSMLSRSLAGLIDNTLVLALPGSTNGAKESMDAVFPSVLHLFKVLKGFSHDKQVV